MFKKIDIKKFGLYKDFRWMANLPEMSRVNIIYGRNYSGKTTLSRIFDGIAQGQLHKNYTDGEFTLYTDNDAEPNVTEGNMKDCPYAIRVYNSEYVKRNLSWLNDEEGGEILPFALIGSDNVEAQKAIDRIDEQLGSVEEKKGLLFSEQIANQEFKAKEAKYNETTNWLENQLKSKANGDIKKKNYFVKQGTNYIVTNIKNDIGEILKREELAPENEFLPVFHKYSLDDKVVLTEEEKVQLRKTIDEVQKVEIKPLPESESHLKEYEKEVRDLVTKKITLTKTLQELVENDFLQTWVDKGRELNKDRKTCAFCGNPISKERWEELNAHFSKESDELRGNVLMQKEKLETAEVALDNYLEKKGFTKENIYTANSSEYEAVMKEWNSYVTDYKKAVGELAQMLDSRLANIFKPLDIEEKKLSIGDISGIVSRINTLIEVNNAYGLKLNEEKQTARDKLRLDYIYQFCTDIHYTETLERQEREEAEKNEKWGALINIAANIGLLRKERKQKELDKKDEGKAAKKVTTLLVNHFGNGSLSLEPETVEDDVDMETGEVKPRTRFVIKRGSDYAKNLSEGEKSLISFCYFIAQMDDELKGPDAGKLVIFIDDPISSLDSSHIFFMYSLIDTVLIKPTKFGQMFISTHNLEFLRFLKRIKPTGSKGNKTIRHYVAVKLGKGTKKDYRCEIREMPKYLSKYMTEYNFLFEQIYEIAKLDSEEEQALYGEKYTQYYNIGNNMRKFMECYLFNRYPDAEEPLAEHIGQLFEGNVPSELNRIVNEYSHLTWAERGMRVMDVPEVVMAAKEIIKTLKMKDPEHFAALCNTVGKDKNVEF